MAELTTLARPYAKAAFEHARDNGQLGDWSSTLHTLAAVVDTPTVSRYLKAPQLTREQKAQAILDVLGDSVGNALRNFIQVLADNDRLPLLSQITELFEAYKAEQEKSEDVEVISAFALSAEQQDKLAKVLSARLSREVRLHTVEDASLIGGLIVRAGDLVIDGSVRGKIAKLAEALKS